MIDIDPSHISSLTPPSPGAHSNEEGLDEDDSTCQFRIRPIESLASPTKSITPAKSKRDTDKDEVIEVIQLHNGNTMNVAGNPGKICNVDVAWKSKDLGNKKTTLTEWLQSTFKCDKCKKLFISEDTLNVHKKICGVEATESGHISPAPGVRIDHEDGSNESVVDSAPSLGDDSSNEDGGDFNGHVDNLENDDKETTEESLSSAPNTRTCTIRILRKAPEVAHPPGTRFCKYCSTSISSHHFSRHRITMKHKLNKRQHKRAKKLGIAGASTNGNGTTSNSVVDADTDKNVKIVKIIYVTKSGTEGESQNSTDSISGPQSVEKEDTGVGERGNEKGSISKDDNDNHEVIDISD